MQDELRTFIKEHSIFKRSVLAKAINESDGNFSNWLESRRPMTLEKQQKLAQYLTPYGFKQTQS